MRVRKAPRYLACEEYLKFKILDESASQYILVSLRADGWRVVWKSEAKTDR